MIGCILTGHGSFATGLGGALEMIAGQQENFETVCFLEEKSLETFSEDMRDAMLSLRQKCSGVIVFSDLLGGTPFRTAMIEAQAFEDVEVIAGVNLPILLESMDYNILQILLIFLIRFIAAIDQFSFLESLYQPIVTGMVVGLILGDLQTGLIVGGTYQLMTIGNMPVGGAQPPNAVIGGIMAAVLAITLKLEPTVAVATAIPFSLLGQYAVTLLFSLMSPVMAVADRYAHEADTKGIDKINYLAMAAIGALFGLVVTLFFIGGATFGQQVVDTIPKWLMGGLGAAGGMMRYVGFAILLKVMVSKEMWGFYFMGFGLATIVMAAPSLSGPALIILAFIGFAVAFWDYQIQAKFKLTTGSQSDFGGEEDGI